MKKENTIPTKNQGCTKCVSAMQVQLESFIDAVLCVCQATVLIWRGLGLGVSRRFVIPLLPLEALERLRKQLEAQGVELMYQVGEREFATHDFDAVKRFVLEVRLRWPTGRAPVPRCSWEAESLQLCKLHAWMWEEIGELQTPRFYLPPLCMSELEWIQEHMLLEGRVLPFLLDSTRDRKGRQMVVVKLWWTRSDIWVV